MNRRELLKRLAGIPLLGALIPAAARDFDTATAKVRMRYLPMNPTHVYVRLHEFNDRSYCVHCGASEERIEDGLEPLGCWKRPA